MNTQSTQNTQNTRRSSTALIITFSAAGFVLLCVLLMLSSFPTLAAGSAKQPHARREVNAQLDPTDTDEPTATDKPDPTDRPQPFNPYDGRVDARAGDRVAVYCYDKYREIEVWGTDEQSNGIYLTTFEYDDVLAAGKKGQTLGVGKLGTVSLSVDTQYHFYLIWNGPYNALKHGDFQKSFSCVFLGGSFTPRPTIPKPTRTRAPVFTVTPAPTVTPVPTQSLY